eukprot:tig00020943_g16325.t1
MAFSVPAAGSIGQIASSAAVAAPASPASCSAVRPSTSRREIPGKLRRESVGFSSSEALGSRKVVFAAESRASTRRIRAVPEATFRPVDGVSKHARAKTAEQEERLSVYHNLQAAAGKSSHDPAPRKELRIALPSKGRMAEDTLGFLSDCGVGVKRTNPRAYQATIKHLQPNLQVWFQRATDIVRKVMDGDVDFGMVGYDLIAEEAFGSEEVVIIHDALGYGQCHLGIAVPTAWADVNSIEDLARLARERSPDQPLRVVSKYHANTKKFFDDNGITPYRLVYADGALEANPHMGCADIIVDLVSTGQTLRENQLKEIKGGTMITSESCFIANRTALLSRPEALSICHEMLERFEAHLRAQGQYVLDANIKAKDEAAAAAKLFTQPDLGGLAGPTIARVFPRAESAEEEVTFAVSVCVPQERLYSAIRQMRAVGGTGVLVKPVTYIFEDEPQRWTDLLAKLGL